MGAAAYQAAITSYMKAENASSDWYLNSGITNSMTWVGPGGNSGSNLSVVSVANISVETGLVAIATMSDGTHRAYRSNASPSYMVYLDNGVLTASSSTTKLANESNLSLIKSADNLVTGWIVASSSESDTTIEEP